MTSKEFKKLPYAEKCKYMASASPGCERRTIYNLVRGSFIDGWSISLHGMQWGNGHKFYRHGRLYRTPDQAITASAVLIKKFKAAVKE